MRDRDFCPHHLELFLEPSVVWLNECVEWWVLAGESVSDKAHGTGWVVKAVIPERAFWLRENGVVRREESIKWMYFCLVPKWRNLWHLNADDWCIFTWLFMTSAGFHFHTENFNCFRSFMFVSACPFYPCSLNCFRCLNFTLVWPLLKLLWMWDEAQQWN